MIDAARFFAALWLSEGWYESWRINGRLHHKARGIVLFDRVMAGEIAPGAFATPTEGKTC